MHAHLYGWGTNEPQTLNLELYQRYVIKIAEVEIQSVCLETGRDCHPSVLNGKASSINIELFGNKHGDSGGYLHQTISSITLQRRLATVDCTGMNGIQS